jgi:hypothetical protein
MLPLGRFVVHLLDVGGDPIDQMVLADVESLQSAGAGVLGVRVAVAAAVGGAAVVPVRVEPTPAESTFDRAGECESSASAVLCRAGRTDLLGSDEVAFADEGWVCWSV